ncbi:phospholipase D family protein [Croceibacterium ferulae]|uniref:phospholipase D family protein n=1 Tax=Croceibacterium ferulae TaxID=1854641 RepID=UPI0019D433B1|nr:phospholipase D family protein [Croceibacterium ferulae]
MRVTHWIRTHPLAAGAAALATIFAGLALASRLPRRNRAGSEPIPQDAPPVGETRLAKGAQRQCADHPGLSGLHLLEDGLDAFAARLLLIRQAERTLDLQYYIWHGDRTGTLLLEELHKAAERGVRIRLLLDDNGIAGLDRALGALDGHPRIEVRLFNPFRIRWPKAIGYLTDFPRLNRRMHNKSLTADCAATIVGGRNVGDEYYSAHDGALFADLDVLAIGPVVDEVTEDFERYWTCAAAFPAAQILHQIGRPQRRKLEKRASVVERDPSARAYVERVETLPLVDQLGDGTLPLHWAEVDMISDDPAKAWGGAKREGLLAGQLAKAIGEPQQQLGIISGYFVPGQQGVTEICELARQGVTVCILTNGYSASDVPLVHAGYAPWRRQLLEAGVHLWEIARRSEGHPSRKERRRGVRLGIGSNLAGSGTGRAAAYRGGASTLHAKTFTVDRDRLFIGSFNFDQRSIDLNTEMGFMIRSPELAAKVADSFEGTIPGHAWRVRLAADGAMEWEREGEVCAEEPGMGWRAHLLVAIGQRLPIAWLL